MVIDMFWNKLSKECWKSFFVGNLCKKTVSSLWSQLVCSGSQFIVSQRLALSRRFLKLRLVCQIKTPCEKKGIERALGRIVARCQQALCIKSSASFSNSKPSWVSQKLVVMSSWLPSISNFRQCAWMGVPDLWPMKSLAPFENIISSHLSSWKDAQEL